MTSRLWYLVAFLVFALGIGAAILLLTSRLGGMQDALKRVVVPGENVIALDEPGTYTIFHETNGTVDGVVYTVSDISGLRISLLSAATGDAVPLVPGANSTYSFGGSSGVGLLEFTVETPGDYRLSAAYEDGRAEPRTILSVSNGFLGNLLRTVFGAIGLIFGSIILAIVIAVKTFLGRRKAQTAASSAGAA